MIVIRSVADMNLAIVRNLHRLDLNSFDVVVGIPRSGVIPASLISTHLQKPLADVEGFRRGLIYKRSWKKTHGDRILLVDDSVGRGTTFNEAVVKLNNSASKIIKCAVYGPPYPVENKDKCDIWFEECGRPMVFQWSLWKHKRLPLWGFDFDGVFCRDPNKKENDDGPNYINFLRNVPPLFLPTREIGHIITGRYEDYREHTLYWLNRHGIKYQSLTMMPRDIKGRGRWKASIAKQLGVELFIESTPHQAKDIARESGIQVWCIETQSVYRVDQ